MFRATLLPMLVMTAFALNAAPIDPPTRPTPMVRTLTLTAANSAVIAAGLNLGKEFVTSVHLFKGDETFDLTITSQSSEKITAKLPADLKPGRYGFMVLTNGDVPRFIEEPVVLILE